jgi:hypothetical protein
MTETEKGNGFVCWYLTKLRQNRTKKNERKKGTTKPNMSFAIQVEENSPLWESNKTIAFPTRPIPTSFEGPNLRHFQETQFLATSVFPKSGVSSYPGMLPA